MKYDAFIKELCPPLDLQWRKYRRRAAKHRVDARMKELEIQGYEQYLEKVRTDPAEAAALPDRMRVTVTRFFREKRGWDELRDRILPGIISTSGSSGVIRAWSAGCCGGEEPYSLAILWLQYLLPLYPEQKLEIIATDIDTESLERAAAGIYGHQSLREVPHELRDQWFSRVGDQWRLSEEPRGLVTFRQSNLMTEPPPLGMDLVLCRYLPFTYYHGGRLGAAAAKLWEALRPDGVLMVGAKEALVPPALQFFEPVPDTRFFYRRA